MVSDSILFFVRKLLSHGKRLYDILCLMGRSKRYLLTLFSVVAFLFSCQLLISRNPVVIGKSFWPIWDAFECGMEHEFFGKRVTTFRSFETYSGIVDAIVSGETDASLATIYEAILVKSKGVPIKIILLLDYM